MLPDDIHAVINETDRVTLSLHVYGKHINYTGRSQFNPDKKTETPFVLKIEQAGFRPFER
jgi:predicted metal-dependent enzyme (double-stranded beta helix superfamily)